jgi:hypothetical protein
MSRPKSTLPRPLLAVFALTLAAPASAATFDLDLLSVWQQRNTVQVPNDAANSRFSLTDVIGKGPTAGVRATLVFDGFRPGHQWRLLAAPFSIDDSGTLAAPIRFQNTTFAAGAVDAKYRFDSYRATYRLPLTSTTHWDWHWGVTAKIRNAEIALSQGAVSASKTNTGLVPLLHLSGEAKYGAHWRASIDFDGLASPQGRAIDLGARVGYAITPTLEVFAGARIVEGGSDNDEVYNFAQLNQLSLGLRARF